MKLLFLPVLLLTFFSCKRNSDPNCTEEKSEYTFSNNKKIDTVHYPPTIFQATISAGASIVFSYNYSSRTCENIVDGGHADRLIFEVPAGSNSFEYNDDLDMQNGKCYFIRSCFCANVTYRLVSGTIKGTRISDNQWTIQVNVTEPLSNISTSFIKPFVLVN